MLRHVCGSTLSNRKCEAEKGTCRPGHGTRAGALGAASPLPRPSTVSAASGDGLEMAWSFRVLRWLSFGVRVELEPSLREKSRPGVVPRTAAAGSPDKDLTRFDCDSCHGACGTPRTPDPGAAHTSPKQALRPPSTHNPNKLRSLHFQQAIRSVAHQYSCQAQQQGCRQAAVDSAQSHLQRSTVGLPRCSRGASTSFPVLLLAWFTKTPILTRKSYRRYHRYSALGGADKSPGSELCVKAPALAQRLLPHGPIEGRALRSQGASGLWRGFMKQLSRLSFH